MKNLKPHTLAASLLLLGVSFPSYAQLMFSQYIDGTSNKKGVEILNPDATSVNLADYEIHQFSNGSSTKSMTVEMSGSLGAKQKYVVGRSELEKAIGSKVNLVKGLSFNGDDALVLVYKGTPIDRFGRVGEKPASGGWGSNPSSNGNSFSRVKQSNSVASIDPNAIFNLESEWTVWSDRNAFDQYLGAGTDPKPPVDQISCRSNDTPIANLASAQQNERYTIRGIITADYRYANGMSGFYVQTPDSKANKTLTNAIFVYIPASSKIKGGSIGKEVILNGRLSNYKNQLQMDELGQDVLDCNQAASDAIKPLELNLPFNNFTDVMGNSPKRYQGMLVKIPQTLTVSENYNYGRFGELALSLNRLYTPTNLYPAGSAEAKALAQKNLLSKITLDDGFGTQNLGPWLPEKFSAANTLRSGYQVKNIQGILEYRFTGWRIQPIATQPKPEIVTTTNPRSTLQAKSVSQIRAAAFNVLNYDNGKAKGFPTERGADSKAEFDRQHAKIVSALKAIDADVYGLMEIANNGYDDKSAIAYLAKALGPDWKYVAPPKQNQLGTDAIAVAILYNSKRVKPINAGVVFDDLSQKNRVTMAQSFQPINGGKIFTVIPNHLKSKGCGSGSSAASGAEADQGDGQSCWNPTRVQHVQALMNWMAKNPTQVEGKPNFLLLGDMNSYAKEDPILALEKANYKTLINDEKIGQGKAAYSYVFGVESNKDGYGGAGNLDYAIADSDLYPWVKRAFTWAINADEPPVLDYNEEYKTAEQIKAFYADDAYRSSDHDPVIVDLDFNPQIVDNGNGSGNGNGNNGNNDSGSGSAGLWSLLGLAGLGITAMLRRRNK